VGLLSRIFRPSAVKAAEGDYRSGPYLVSGGWLPAGSAWNFWQFGNNVRTYGQRSAMVEACVSRYSQTVAMCPGDHWRRRDDGGRDRVSPQQSALARILRRPNDYQTISDFLLNLTRSLFLDGNAYAVAFRNDRGEVSELHLMPPRHCAPQVAETGEIFYHVGGNDVVERRLGSGIIAPARDVLHVRMNTPRHPLKGESPIMAAALAEAAGDIALQQQVAFFTNQARPSFVLTTDEKLTAEQAVALRQRWNEQTTGENSGGTPILSWGTKPMKIGDTARDAQLAETMKMSEEQIALAFGVPLTMFGRGDGPKGSTEALMSSWLASGLGFVLNHVEEAFGQLFRLRGYPDEYLELNTDALLRSAHKDRIEALARGVQGGIYSPDEARAREDLPRVSGGHGSEPRVQQQVVPLSFGSVPPAPPPAIEPPAAQEGVEDDERHHVDAIVRRLEDHARLH
jgi:HK97 family phage portal protein